MPTHPRQVVVAGKAPKPIGPYSVGIVHGELVFASGMLGLDPQTGELAPGGVEAQTRQSLKNIAAILEARRRVDEPGAQDDRLPSRTWPISPG